MSMALLGPFGRIALDAPVYTLGSAPDNQLVLHDPKISPRHAALQLQGQQYSIVDLGSIDGTYLNDQRLGSNMPAFLKHGDRIRLGDTLYTVEAIPADVPTYPPTVAAGSPPMYDPTQLAQQPPAAPAYGQSNPGFPPYGQAQQPPAAPAYGQSNPGFPPYGQAQQPPAAPAYGQSNPGFPAYGQSNVSSPGYPPYAPNTPSNPNAQNAAYTPAPGQPWGAGMPPGYPAPVQPQKKGGMKILVIVLIIFLVLGGGGATAFYIVNLPQPTISVNSAYSVGATQAGASATTFTVSGKKFSHNSTITFLLDGTTVPGSSPVQSDGDGLVKDTTLTVTDAWAVGKHTLTAKDAAGYATKVGVPITIVTPGEDKTPGPNGAPTDSATGTVDATIQAADGSTTPISLKVIAGTTGDTVCSTDDTGQSHMVNGTLSDGTTVVETVTETCSGSYKGGKLTYTETVTSDQFVFTSGTANGLTCTAQVPYVARHLEGTFTSATAINGSSTSDQISLTCKLGTVNQNSSIPAESDTWSGIASMQA